MVTHSKDRSHKCTNCSKSFLRQGDRRHHICWLITETNYIIVFNATNHLSMQMLWKLTFWHTQVRNHTSVLNAITLVQQQVIWGNTYSFMRKISHTNAHNAIIQVHLVKIWRVTYPPTLAKGHISVCSATMHVQAAVGLKVTSRNTSGASPINATTAFIQQIHWLLWKHIANEFIQGKCLDINVAFSALSSLSEIAIICVNNSVPSPQSLLWWSKKFIRNGRL